METLTLKNLNVQISKEEVNNWLNVEFSPLKIREKKKRLKELNVEIDPDTLRVDLSSYLRKQSKYPKYISEVIVKANNGTLGDIDSELKTTLFFIKKLPEGKDLQITIE
jgi:hypothetical protein